MSIRTVIEINHDHLYELEHNPDDVQAFLYSLKGIEPVEIPGIRILGQRHHSETLKLTMH